MYVSCRNVYCGINNTCKYKWTFLNLFSTNSHEFADQLTYLANQNMIQTLRYQDRIVFTLFLAFEVRTIVTFYLQFFSFGKMLENERFVRKTKTLYVCVCKC